MSSIPGKVTHRIAATKAELLRLLSPREFGYCTGDKTAYVKIQGRLEPLSLGVPNPSETSLLMGFAEDAETYTFNWRSLESATVGSGDDAEQLWSRLAEKGFYAAVAEKDTEGRNIAEALNYASVLIARYGETPYADIAAAIESGKTVIMADTDNSCAFFVGAADQSFVFASPVSYGAEGGCRYTKYFVTADNRWELAHVDLGEAVPTENSKKLLTSGGAFAALRTKADAANIAPGAYAKVNVNKQGIVTGGGPLDGGDIPDHSAATLTSGHLDPARLQDDSIPAEKLELRKRLMVDGTTIGATVSSGGVTLKVLTDSAPTQNSAKPITSGAVYDALHGSEGFGWFTSANIETQGGEESVVQATFAVEDNTTIVGDAIEFEATSTVDGVTYGNVYLNPGIYLGAFTINVEWTQNPVNKMCSVVDLPFDFSYAHTETVTTVRMMRYNQRTRIGVLIPLDTDVPAGLKVSVGSFHIFSIKTGILEVNGLDMVHCDNTLTGAGTSASPLSIQPAITELESQIGDIATLLEAL